ncbi:hypothetical protein BMI86_10250 [Thioclava sp. DLFJ5-1]|uniref:hypothetical protein n=1 Tax=Thioclava sp. DLFJ5-1 TaxID=1915314 RepID=UPI0009961BC3|nr:hypothetical protein [Thioclava sp. DLFJ5-1]OOY20878.1 hypothetical protein BMI86_10250 [Thioclava sp. DLFJ5-1]
MPAPTLLLNERPQLDLDIRHFEHRSGNILVIGSWLMDHKAHRTEPCLVLIDARRDPRRIGKGARRAVPCVIPLNEAWRWTLERGDPAHMSRVISEWIGDGLLPGDVGDKKSVFRVLDAIQSRLRDLYFMPPLPMKAALRHSITPTNVIGDVTITERDSGKVVAETEITKNASRS